jgi:hypothetical protein
LASRSPRPATLTGRQLLGQLVAARIAVELILGGVGGLGLLEDLARKLLVIDVRVATGVGMKLGPVDRDDADLRQARPGAEQQHLAEQAPQRPLVALDEPRDRCVVGPLLRRQHPEGDVLDARPLDNPRGTNPARVGVKQQADHHRRLVGRTTAPITPIGRIEALEVHLLDRRHHEPRQMVLRQPLANIRRHQERLLAITRDEALAHREMVLNPPDSTDLRDSLTRKQKRANRPSTPIASPRPTAGGPRS